MKLSKEFIKAWRAWNRISEVPISGRDYRNAPSLKSIIDELAHLDTYIYSLGSSVISGSSGQVMEIAISDISTLDRLEAELSKCDVSEETKSALETYIKTTHALLNEITKLPQT
jgi:hypothetical protein